MEQLIPDGSRVFLWGVNGPELGTVRGYSNGNYSVEFDEEFEGSRFSDECLEPEQAEEATKIEKLMADEGLSIEDAAKAALGIQRPLPGINFGGGRSS